MTLTKKSEFHYQAANRSNSLTHIILLSAIIVFSNVISAYGSDSEYSLLMKRLLKASRLTKMAVIDSLFRLEPYDYELTTRIFQSEEYIKSCEFAHYEKLWLDKFVNADAESKIYIIDSVTASFDINCELLSDILLTSKYASHFPSIDVFEAFRTNTVLKMNMNNRSHCVDVLAYYNHFGRRSRQYLRPLQYDFEFNWQKRVAEVKDLQGVTWAVTYIWWYPESRNNLWLVKKEPGSDTWQGPWFTGVAGPIPLDDSLSHLRIFGNSLYLKNPHENTFQLVDLDYITRDSDRDGFYDIEEDAFGTDPFNIDSDGDSLIDSEDINPLASGVRYPTARDFAIRSVIRLLAIRNYTVNVYVLSGDINPDMEYFTNSPNPIFLPNKRDGQFSDFGSKSPGGLPISIKIKDETDSLVIVSAATRNEETLYYMEKRRRRWVIDSVGVKFQHR